MDKLVIDASKKSRLINIKELLNYKDLFFVLAYRDLKVRYAQTFLGLFWVLLQPLASLLIFTMVFGRIIKTGTEGVPYPLFAMSGLIIWIYFSYVMSKAGDAIISNQGMVKKIYFPRLILPLSKILVGLVDFAIAFVFLLIMFVYFGFTPSSNIYLFPVFLLFAILGSVGVGIWFSALTIEYRDFKHVLPFVTQLGLYVTPVAYPVDIIPEKYQLFYYLNPVAGIVAGSRYSLLGIPINWEYTMISLAVCLILFITSVFYFKKAESQMADLV